jgi:hypothetical protein
MVVKPGDRVVDCDPRSNGAVKEVVEVSDTHATVRRPGVKQTSKVRLDRIHDLIGKKKGYCLLRCPKPLDFNDAEWDLLRAFEETD